MLKLDSWAAQAVRTAAWSNTYGLARTLLAIGTASTMMLNSSTTLFRPALGAPPAPYCHVGAGPSLFCLVPIEHLQGAQWLGALVLMIVASGWQPRLTAIPHWWLSWSLFSSATIPDGGDQVAAVLTLLLLPIALTDPRPSHWAPLAHATGASGLFPAVTVTLIRIQVAGIYLHSSIAKLGVPEWIDGTALYYWLLDPAFGLPGWLRPVGELLLSSPAVAIGTWAVLGLEFLIAVALVLRPAAHPYLLLAGLAFHVLIGSLMGLTSFSLAMSAALILYLRPADRPFPRQLLSALRMPAFGRVPRPSVGASS